MTASIIRNLHALNDARRFIFEIVADEIATTEHTRRVLRRRILEAALADSSEKENVSPDDLWRMLLIMQCFDELCWPPPEQDPPPEDNCD